MSTINEADFWKWLKDKETKVQKGFEPIPLYIHVDLPIKPSENTQEDNVLDYTVDNNILSFI